MKKMNDRKIEKKSFLFHLLTNAKLSGGVGILLYTSVMYSYRINDAIIELLFQNDTSSEIHPNQYTLYFSSQNDQLLMLLHALHQPLQSLTSPSSCLQVPLHLPHHPW